MDLASEMDEQGHRVKACEGAYRTPYSRPTSPNHPGPTRGQKAKGPTKDSLWLFAVYLQPQHREPSK